MLLPFLFLYVYIIRDALTQQVPWWSRFDSALISLAAGADEKKMAQREELEKCQGEEPPIGIFHD